MIESMFNSGPGQKTATSKRPTHAPIDYPNWDSNKAIIDNGEVYESFGSGVASSLKCEVCGHGGADLEDQKKNKLIYLRTNIQRNGNYSSLSEIFCANCQMYTTIETWEEG